MVGLIITLKLQLGLLGASSTQVMWDPLAYKLSTITVKAIKPTATIFENVCLLSTSASLTSAARPYESGTYVSLRKISDCMPLLMTQGPSTWEYSNNNTFGIVHVSCSFSGGPLPNVVGVCTLSAGGDIGSLVKATESWSGAMSTLSGYEAVEVVVTMGFATGMIHPLCVVSPVLIIRRICFHSLSDFYRTGEEHGRSRRHRIRWAPFAGSRYRRGSRCSGYSLDSGAERLGSFSKLL
jgi:hypothetical protein